jgi:hypothetical protein
MNGTEYFCRTQPVPGSRVQKAEVCMTWAELQAARERVEALMQRVPVQGSMMGSMGGMPPH